MKNRYWLEVDPRDGSPTGSACWAHYPKDEPIKGYWILVEEVEEENTIEDTFHEVSKKLGW